jgi:hypothetical protein
MGFNTGQDDLLSIVLCQGGLERRFTHTGKGVFFDWGTLKELSQCRNSRPEALWILLGNHDWQTKGMEGLYEKSDP